MIKIHTQVYGKGKPLVLIHGWAMHSGIWRQFAQQLAKHYQVTCLDLPGHGLSETVKPYTLDQISKALIENMPESPCCILGWSLGTSVAITLAENFPERVDSLILLAGNPKFIQSDDWNGMPVELLNDFGNQLVSNCQLTLIRFLAVQVIGLPDSKKLLKDLKAAIHEYDPPTQTVLQSGLEILKESDLRHDLTELRCPISLIFGNMDTLIPVKVCLDIQKLIPDSDLNIIKGAGHIPFLSHPTEVIQSIKRFL